MSRRIRTTFHTSAVAEDRPLDDRERLNYYEAARQLERIANVATDIARTAPASYLDETTAVLESLGDVIVSATEAIVGAITTENLERARERLRQYRAHLREADRTIGGMSDIEYFDCEDDSTTALIGFVRQCVGYLRNLVIVGQHSIYLPG